MNWASRDFHTLKSFLESKSQNSVLPPNDEIFLLLKLFILFFKFDDETYVLLLESWRDPHAAIKCGSSTVLH